MAPGAHPLSLRTFGQRFSLKRTLFGLLLIALTLHLTGSRPPSTLDTILATGEIRVLSRNGPTTYYEGPNGTTGFEYVLLQGFADYLGVRLVIKEEENLGTMIHKVTRDEAHFAAAGLTITPQRQQQVQFTRPYFEVTQQLVYNHNRPAPESLEDIIGGDILVIAGSSHAERLRQLQLEYPELRWREQPKLEMIDLLEMVHRGEIDYTIVDSNALQINRQVYPRARAAFEIGEPESLAWAFPWRDDTSLYDRAQAYLQQLQEQGTLDQLIAEFFEDTDPVSPGGALLFAHRLEHRLPQWEPQLQAAAREVGLSWHLLAAVSYQESHWNPKARSHTGVRGLMMLTRTTAAEMGISNRIDPEQSILGGARYLKSLYDRLPERIGEPHRTWFALAAYNVGMGHLEDARILTQRHGGDPDIWEDVAEHLPLLAKRQYYRNTRYGYARGWEPVDYVRNIRQFQDIIAWHDQQEQRRLALMERTEPVIEESAESDNRSDSIMPMSVL